MLLHRRSIFHDKKRIDWQAVAEDLPNLFRERKKARQKWYAYNYVIEHLEEHLEEIELEED